MGGSATTAIQIIRAVRSNDWHHNAEKLELGSAEAEDRFGVYYFRHGSNISQPIIALTLLVFPIGPNIQINRLPELFPPITAHMTLQMYSDTWDSFLPSDETECKQRNRDEYSTAVLQY